MRHIGERVEINCQITSDRPFRVVWLHNNDTVYATKSGISLNNTAGGSILVISKVSKRHQGLYTCRAVSKNRSIQKVAKLAVLGKVKSIESFGTCHGAHVEECGFLTKCFLCWHLQF